MIYSNTKYCSAIKGTKGNIIDIEKVSMIFQGLEWEQGSTAKKYKEIF